MIFCQNWKAELTWMNEWMTLLLAQLNRLNTMCRHSKVTAKIIVHDEHCYWRILFSSFTLSSSCFRILLTCSTGVIFGVFHAGEGKREAGVRGEWLGNWGPHKSRGLKSGPRFHIYFEVRLLTNSLGTACVTKAYEWSTIICHVFAIT